VTDSKRLLLGEAPAKNERRGIKRKTHPSQSISPRYSVTSQTSLSETAILLGVALHDSQNPPLSRVLHCVTPEQLIAAHAFSRGATLFTAFPTPSSSAASVHKIVASGSTWQHLKKKSLDQLLMHTKIRSQQERKKKSNELTGRN
jgi:hypothetical protein